MLIRLTSNDAILSSWYAVYVSNCMDVCAPLKRTGSSSSSSSSHWAVMQIARSRDSFIPRCCLSTPLLADTRTCMLGYSTQVKSGSDQVVIWKLQVSAANTTNKLHCILFRSIEIRSMPDVCRIVNFIRDYYPFFNSVAVSRHSQHFF